MKSHVASSVHFCQIAGLTWVEQVWIHPKDRPTITKEERKANQKLVKEQQVNLLSHN